MTVQLVDRRSLERSWSGTDRPPAWETVLGDGVPLRHEVGDAGDHRFEYGETAFHLSADAGNVLCAPEDHADPAWQRQLLDTILFSASFVNGFELLHASAVECEIGVLAFVAPSGGGKSSLVAELMRRGMELFCDDVLALVAGRDAPLCFPGPAVMNLPDSVPTPGALGTEPIARFPQENETWVLVPGAATEPRPLGALYVLDRDAEEPGVTDFPSPTLLDALPYGVSLPHDLERARSRFRLFSALAEQVPVRRLEGAPETDPSELADLVEASLDRPLAELPA